jgi:hypothetical protein
MAAIAVKNCTVTKRKTARQRSSAARDGHGTVRTWYGADTMNSNPLLYSKPIFPSSKLGKNRVRLYRI